MMPPALKRSTLSAATQICALEWIVWQHWWRRRREISLMYLIPFIFSVGGEQTVSKDWYGKGTDGSCYIRDCQKAVSNGRAVQRKCVP